MSKIREPLTHFQVATKLLGVILKNDNKIKFLRVAINNQDYWVKLPKDLRKQLDFEIKVGSWLYIQGTQEIDRKKENLKLTATSIKPLLPPEALFGESMIVQPPIANKRTQKASILICQKSDCWKRGGKEICQQLETELRDRGLDDQVQIKTTGCMKHCKQGPNIVFMPDKARYSQVKPHQVSSLVDRHFPKTDQAIKTTQAELLLQSAT